jgi:hypothetical protein
MVRMEILGIDVGGSGIKGAPVNIQTGKFSAERFRLKQHLSNLGRDEC